MGLSDSGDEGEGYFQHTGGVRHRDEDSREIASLTKRLRHAKEEVNKWRHRYEEERANRLALEEKQELDSWIGID